MRQGWRRTGLGVAAATVAGGGPGLTQPQPAAPPTVEAATTQCRTLAGDGAAVETADAYPGTRLHGVYWRFRDGYRVAGEQEATAVLRLVTTTWGMGGGGQGATIAFRDGSGRWHAAHLAYGADRATQYNVWRRGVLTPAVGSEMDALLAQACLAGEPRSVLGEIKAADGAVIGKCGDAVGSITHTLEVSAGGRTRQFTRQCPYGLAGALAARLHRPELVEPVTEERY